MVRKEDGQSLVEFALILPLFLLLLVGVIDFGRILYTQIQLELVSQESVRLGGLGKTDEEIRAYAKNQFTQGDSSLLTVNISPTGTRKSGTYVTVDISYPETLLDALGSMAVPYTIQSSSTIRVE
ncbi:TadE-like protein [Cytobacillus oceanisediminis]|jgi:Flp pilus assembly protein TadG|uniref:TadE-like protein n=1 Tax=Cytobacillus oceanisediminis TaxID=665099 RepID=A0A2V3A0M8_9BACI|nr:TadE family protein [Cytobacillus oceanisediminis]PWW27051.1 TadE-like protein [Cytobacillus oceanisediminis]